ncbi:MAG: glycogen(starch) synthase [archaeon GW2011_AR3]|nr:MAG: glycogen(starch) synthase [archaeon GW2011_AR3]
MASVTTDLAGFGRYICKECKPSKFPGIYVVNRMNRNDGSVVENLKQILLDYTQLTREERIANKYEAKKISSTSDWKNFAENYIRAHNMAVDKH